MSADMPALNIWDRLGRLSGSIERGLGISPKAEHSVDETADQSYLFVQTVPLAVSRLSKAKKSIALTLPKLSPLPTDQISWDVIRKTGESGGAEFHLGIITNQRLSELRAQALEAEHITIKTASGDSYTVSDSHGHRIKAKRWLGIAALSLCTYLAGFWALSQWQGRLSDKNDLLRLQSMQSVRSIELSKADSDLKSNHLTTLETYAGQNLTADHMQTLSVLMSNLQEQEGLQTLTLTPFRIDVSGLAHSPSELAESLRVAFEDRSVSLGAVKFDRVSGLNKFSLTIEASKPTTETQVRP